MRGLRADRNRPDLAALGAEPDPERFVWRILPHAARSFGASIVVLPKQQARAAAVAYLYCRMLDTYEDLADVDARTNFLEEFAERFDSDPMSAPPALVSPQAIDAGDRVHLLLLDRWQAVDSVYASLPAETRLLIAHLVHAMAAGMVWSSAVFDSQGGVLSNEEQLLRYCHNVIGEPALFALQLVGERPLTPQQRLHARAASEMIQLANVTRDIEKDLDRGVVYDPSLRPFLSAQGGDGAKSEAVLRSRRRHMRLALQRASSYRLLFEGFGRHRPSTRVAAVLMLLFTDLHYRRTAAAVGEVPWEGPRGSMGTVMRALPSVLSQRYANRTVRRVERHFLAAAGRFAP